VAFSRCLSLNRYRLADFVASLEIVLPMAQQLCQVSPGGGHAGMVLTLNAAPNLDGLPQQRLGLLILPLEGVDKAQSLQQPRHLPWRLIGQLLVDGQGLLEERLGPVQVAQAVADRSQLIEEEAHHDVGVAILLAPQGQGFAKERLSGLRVSPPVQRIGQSS